MDFAASVTRRLAKVASPSSGTASKQLYFVGFLLTFTVIVSISHPEDVLTPAYLAALGVLALATALAFVAPWERLDTRLAALVPVLDIVAIALVRDLMRDSAVAISLLSFIPALWLVGRLRGRGAAIATLSVAALITVPSLMRAERIDSLILAHSLLLPFTVLQIGLLATGALKVLDAQARRMTATLQEKERLLESAAAGERLLENILDTVDVGIVVVDRDGHDLLMNRAQRRIHRLASPADIEDPDEAQLALRYPGTTCPIPPAERPVRRAVEQETFSNYVVTLGPSGGRSTDFSSSARQILDRHGDRDGAVVVFSDVTSYVEAARAQQRFVAAISHELRTPLTSVIGYLDLAREDPGLSEETRSHLGVANRNAEQLLAIVEDLLQDQVTRSASGGLTLRPHRLSTIAGQVVESASLRAQESGIRLVQELQETPEVPIDEHRITQALTNLLSNALKYTSRGGTVTMSSRLVEGALEIAVADTGIGMSDQEQANLFTDFYRTESARMSTIQGHGIGLAVTRRIVLEHGGQISVRSTPGAGSTFAIRLPLAAADSAV